MYTSSNFLKTVNSIGFLCIFGLIFYLSSLPAATGYETSIHARIHTTFWVVLGLTYCAGVLTVVVAARQYGNHRIPFVTGVLLLVLTVLLTLTLPHLRGYDIWGSGDVLTHLGEITFILESGSLPEGGIYPSIHIVASASALLTKLTPQELSKFLPQIYFFALVLSLYILIRSYLGDSRPIALVLVLVPFYDQSFMLIPFPQSMVLIPLILWAYIFLNSNRPRIKAVLLMLYVGVILLHPMTAMVIVGFLLVYIAFQTIVSQRLTVARSTSTSLTGLFVMLFIIRMEFQNRLFRKFVELSLIKVLALWSDVGDSDATTLDNYSSVVTSNSVETSDLLLLGIFQYGPTVFLGCVSLIASCYLLFDYLKRRTNIINMYFVTSFVLICLFAVSALVVVPFSPGRYFPYINIFQAVVISAAAARYLEFSPPSLDRRVGICLGFIFVLLVASLGTIYPIPSMDRQPNPQITDHQIASVDWFDDYRDSDNGVDYYGITVYRLSTYHGSGSTEIQLHSPPPSHFRYSERSPPTYLITSKKSQRFYPTVYPDYSNFWRYTPQDYDKINSSTGFDRVYSNGEVTVTRVCSNCS